MNTLSDLSQRFAPRYSRRGPRRSELAHRIADSVWRGKSKLLASCLRSAAFLLDMGSAVDFYNRLNRTASLVVASDLPGFSHRESALITAILLAAERGWLPRKYRRSSLLSPNDRERVGQAAVILMLADELERRLPPGHAADAVQISSNGERTWRLQLPRGPGRLATLSASGGSGNSDSQSSSGG